MIIIGLGNPGIKYRATRHNAGYIFVSYLARQYKSRFYPHRGYRMARLKTYGRKIILIKPQCWMNESGIRVAQLIKEYNQKFLVVLDDINLPLGKIRLKARGSDGGHKGLASIIHTLKTEDFPRLRIGIDRPYNNDVVSYVLEKFTPKEKKILKAVIEKGIKGLKLLFKKGFVAGQHYINSINIITEGR